MVPTPRIVFLPGDGIGPEVVASARQVLDSLPIDYAAEEHLLGGCAIDATGVPLPATTLTACRTADAILVGAVGGPSWDLGAVQPEAGLIGLRRELDVYANLRPATYGDVDLVIVRELVGGLYYGPRGLRDDGSAFDTLEYSVDEIQRVARFAFELARTRRGDLVSVDKANVLETSRLWRRVVSSLAADYPNVRLRHALVDSTGMELVMHPESFDVLVMDNTFGDILSDVAAGATGGLGLAASASIGAHRPGIFEPVHGSAPDIAGTGVANPAATLRSLAMLLEHGLGHAELARAVDAAVAHAIDTTPTRDLGGTATSATFTAAVVASLSA